MKPATFCAVLGLVLVACGGNGDDKNAATETEGNAVTATAIPSGLTEYDPDSWLFVKGRDRLRACVEVLDGSASEDAAAEAVETALLEATENARWPSEWGTPAVDAGCPLPPFALEQPERDFGERKVCSEEVGPYMVYAFVANAARLSERFPKDLVDFALIPGVRKAVQEDIAVNGECYQVAESWYLTPEDLSDEELLEKYALNIWPIADVSVE